VRKTIKKIGMILCLIILLPYFSLGTSSFAVKMDLPDDLTNWARVEDVAEDKVWKVEFNYDIDLNTLNSDHIFVLDKDMEIHPTELVLDKGKKDVFVKASKNYRNGETYSLYVVDGIKSIRGKALKKGIKMNFTIKSDIYIDKPWLKDQPAPKRVLYVSPEGRGDGSSLTSPSTLEEAISLTEAGDMVWLLEGAYTGSFLIKNNGTEESPIVYRNYQGQHVKILGQLMVEGDHNWIWGLELTDDEEDEYEAVAIGQGQGVMFINNVIHSSGYAGGLYSWDKMDQIVYGNIIYDGHHNVYTQNSGQVSPRWFVDNISMDAKRDENGKNGPFEFHAYAEGGELSGFRLYRNIFANTGHEVGRALIGGRNNTANTDIILDSNYFYNIDLEMGYARPLQAHITNNTIVNGSLIYEWIWGRGERKFKNPEPTIVKNNSIYINKQEPLVRLRTSAYLADRVEGKTQLREEDVWDYNTYSPAFKGTMHADNIEIYTTSLITWQQKTQEAGNMFDANSKVVDYPTKAQAYLLPNDYERGRAHVLVYGFGQEGEIELDISSLAKIGQSYELRSVKDAFGDSIVSGTYVGWNISVPINGDLSVYLLLVR